MKDTKNSAKLWLGQRRCLVENIVNYMNDNINLNLSSLTSTLKHFHQRRISNMCALQASG